MKIEDKAGKSLGYIAISILMLLILSLFGEIGSTIGLVIFIGVTVFSLAWTILD